MALRGDSKADSQGGCFRCGQVQGRRLFKKRENASLLERSASVDRTGSRTGSSEGEAKRNGNDFGGNEVGGGDTAKILELENRAGTNLAGEVRSQYLAKTGLRLTQSSSLAATGYPPHRPKRASPQFCGCVHCIEVLSHDN